MFVVYRNLAMEGIQSFVDALVKGFHDIMFHSLNRALLATLILANVLYLNFNYVQWDEFHSTI